MKNITIVITGATSGIGELLAKRLATKNNSLILTGRNKEKLKDLKEELSILCKEVITFPVEFSNNKDVKNFASICKEASVVINSAANFGPTLNVLNVSEKEILDAFKVNVLAPLTLVKSVLPFMIKNNYGRIINIGSTGGLSGYPLRSPYCLSKNALVAYTKTLNGEIRSGEYGIISDVKAFCVCPGPIVGERLEKQIKSRAEYKSISTDETRKKFKSILKRFLTPEEVVNKIISLINLEDEFSGQDVITF